MNGDAKCCGVAGNWESKDGNPHCKPTFDEMTILKYSNDQSSRKVVKEASVNVLESVPSRCFTGSYKSADYINSFALFLSA